MPTAGRDEPASQRKICTFKSQLERTMPFWSFEKNLNDEDHVFLESLKQTGKLVWVQDTAFHYKG